ncbi:hypothetical protein [uncultured Ramlibacter sp.]|uniref:hypothetical protein n=1 Tax=uncultured Ramlibacter sp. TaxID=260755 RepID=UPI00260B224F|nr:hypothetical protein [uncultured Ramlibacter sp.]
MKSVKDKSRNTAASPSAAPRQEFEVAYFTKELGRPLQRKMLERQLAALGEGHQASGSHGEDAGTDAVRVPPQADRAG